jgi:hypothetical protein
MGFVQTTWFEALLKPSTPFFRICVINPRKGSSTADGLKLSVLFRFDFCTDAYYIGHGAYVKEQTVEFDSVQYVGCFSDLHQAREFAWKGDSL